MTVNRRRLLCLALALSLLITLIPAATGSHTSARAETKRMGITLDTVNVRYGAGTGEKIIFALPKDHVCEILDTKKVKDLHHDEIFVRKAPVVNDIVLPLQRMALVFQCLSQCLHLQ